MSTITLEMARAKVKMTQEEMARELGTNRVTYADYEKYKTPMRIDLAYKFSQITNVKMDDLIFFKE